MFGSEIKSFLGHPQFHKELNRDKDNYEKFIHDMKIKYKLRTIDRVDNFVDSVDLITKIISASND